jgi:hypothetical protein
MDYWMISGKIAFWPSKTSETTTHFETMKVTSKATPTGITITQVSKRRHKKRKGLNVHL